MRIKYIFCYILLVFSGSVTGQTGVAVPEMSTCEVLIQNFLGTYQIPGASFALSKNGKIVYHRGFGYSDTKYSKETQPHDMFRIASISKPITSIAIMKLIEASKLKLDDFVFGKGGILEFNEAISKAKIKDTLIYQITVRHLLEHSAGWNSNVNCFPSPVLPYFYSQNGCDPFFVPLHVAQELNLQRPVKEEDIIVFMLEKGLNFKPGTQAQYSNFGFQVLGEIIEQISGLEYEEYVKQQILAPLDICDMHIAKTLKSDKFEREVEYMGNGYVTYSCFDKTKTVPWEYGGFNIEAMDACGGWIASSADLVKLLLAVDGFTTKPDILSSATINTMIKPSATDQGYGKGWIVNTSNTYWHNGSLDGTATIFARTAGGYNWAFLLNKRVVGNLQNSFWSDFDKLPWDCIANTSKFPTHDLSLSPNSPTRKIEILNIKANSATLSVDKGNGDKRIITISKNGANEFPSEGMDYEANSDFGKGASIGNHSYVVYNGAGSDVLVTSLEPNTRYYVQSFEYNQSSFTGGNSLYKLCNRPIDSFQTLEMNFVDVNQPLILKVFPNPAADYVIISNPIDNEELYYSVKNQFGKIVLEGKSVQPNLKFDLKGISAGIYLISCKIGPRIYNEKLIKLDH